MWERLLTYLGIAYFLLTGKSTGKMRDYPDALLIMHLQLEWMRVSRHPALSVLAEDPALANEELGEISLSEFSKGVKAGSCSADATSMSNEYRLQGASRDVVHDLESVLELPHEDNYHEVTSAINVAEVDAAEETLKALRKGLHTDPARAYALFTFDATVTTKGKTTGRKVPATAAPVMEKNLTPFFEQMPAGQVWDVAADFAALKTRYFNVPPRAPFTRNSDSDSEDSDEAVQPRPVAPVLTRAGRAAALGP